MHKLGITRRRPRPGLLSLAVLSCALAATTLTGCASFKGEKKKNADPILGEVHPQNSAPYGPTPPPDKAKATSETSHKISGFAAPEPLIAPSPTSNAFLAGAIKPLPGANSLAIPEPGPFQLTANAEPVVRPVSKDPAFVNNSWVAPPSSGTTTPGPFVSQPSNFVDPQIALLQGRGVTQHRADPQPDGSVRLIAIAPLRGNASQVRTYDVTAKDMPAAVQAVIRQIDQTN